MDLLSPDCPIRYIITVNALKEGWDCPFAYILASLANKTSQVDVELLGGVLNIRWDWENDRVYMTGPAVEVYHGEIGLKEKNV